MNRHFRLRADRRLGGGADAALTLSGAICNSAASATSVESGASETGVALVVPLSGRAGRFIVRSLFIWAAIS